MKLSNIESWLLSPAVFGYKLISSKKVYLTYSKNPLLSVGRFMSQIRGNKCTIDGLNDLSDIEVVLYESINDDRSYQVVLQKYINICKEDGYEVLNKRSSVVYKLRTNIVGSRIHVYLESKNKSKILVGVFRKYKDAIKFMNDTYPDLNKIDKIIISRNYLTNEYIEYLKLKNEV